MEDNIKFSKHKEIKGKEYQKYDNYDVSSAIYWCYSKSSWRSYGSANKFLIIYGQFKIIKFRHGNDDKDLRLKYEPSISEI